MTEYTAEQLSARVEAPEPGIVILREVAAGTIESWNILTGKAKELSGSHKSWGLVIDLSEVKDRPDASYREFLKQSMYTIGAAHVAFVPPGGILLRATMRFVATTFPGKNTVHQKLDQALAALRETLSGG